MNKSNLIFTIVSTELDKKISKLTLKNLKDYAKKINSDFLVIDDFNDELLTQDWHKYKTYELLKEYKRICYISIDTNIRIDTPNIFDVVPENKIGMFNEGKYTSRILYIEQASKFYNIPVTKSTSAYYNTNVFVVSRIHRELFYLPEDFIYIDEVDPYLNLMLINSKYEIHSLDWKFNRQEYLDKFIGISRLDSYIVNYKGAPPEMVLDIIQKDIKQWKEDYPKFEYKRNIVISVSAGMGDQICSEPVIRFTQKLYPDAIIHVITHFTRLFEHIEGIELHNYENWKGTKDAALMLHTVPDEKNANHSLSHVMFHPTDFASLSMLRRTLPNIDKTIKLKVYTHDINSIIETLKDKNRTKPGIVVHPGKWWPSKTFPIKWWQEVIDKLSEKLTVYLIGKTIDEKQGYLDVKCPESGFDFRDITSLGEMIALISHTKCTLTNDSSPVHIAGAFDNWLVVIPTAKHPDHIIPYRNGVQNYKSIALYKKLLIDDLETRYTEFYTDTIDMIPKNSKMEDYLPDVQEVVGEIFNIYS